MRLALRPFQLALVLTWTACASAPPIDDVPTWLAAHGASADPADPAFGRFVAALATARIVGLGEATHGQHESFELKRAVTMRLVQEHGFRLVAFEASGTRARACEEFFAGRSDDLDAAVGGLGMLIWNVTENAALLNDLRAWNATAAPQDRVHFVGIDVQDPGAAAARLVELLPADPALGARAVAIATDLQAAVPKLWSGDPAAYLEVETAVQHLVDDLRPQPDPEVALRARELAAGVGMFRSHGGRDAAMADSLLSALARAKADTRAVLWAHNGHVSRGALRHVGSDELAMGGHLGATLGAEYYALGFLFGSGGFQANAQGPDGRWGFRRYVIDAPPTGALEEPFVAAGRGDLLVDLRTAPTDGVVGEWLAAGHGQRWFGGYNIAADFAEANRDAARLLPTFPRGDFDGLAFLATTTAAEPRDPARILGDG